MRVPTIVVALLLTVVAHAAVAAQSPDDSLRFPTVEGRSLAGRSVELPRDFAGALNLVFVAFRRDQQRDVDGWMPLAREAAARDPRLQVYELPTLGRRFRFVRPMMEAGMRRGITDTTRRAHTVLLFIDKAPFERALRIADEDRIMAVLVDRAGMVRWSARGPLTPALSDSLRANLARP